MSERETMSEERLSNIEAEARDERGSVTQEEALELCAALRSSRAEAEQLRKERDQWKKSCWTAHELLDSAKARLAEAEQKRGIPEAWAARSKRRDGSDE